MFKSTTKILISLIASFFTKIDKTKIYWSDIGFNGSNLYFFRDMECIKKINYEKVYKGVNLSDLKKMKVYQQFFFIFMDAINFYQSRIVIHTHGYYFRRKKRQIIINVWHGIPIKGNRYHDFGGHNYIIKTTKNPFPRKRPNDYLVSTSKFTTYLLNHFINEFSANVIYTGYPRNDLIISGLEEKIKKDVFSNYQSHKIIFYAPTYRNPKDSDAWPQNPITNKDLLADLNYFLEQNKIHLILKPHPLEVIAFEHIKSDNIQIIDSKWLEIKNINLYSILSMTDILITDYSSIMFDFLLADKPTIIFDYDYDFYRNTTGLMLDNFDEWAPGHRSKNIKQLINAISEAIEKDPFKDDRNRIKNEIHIFKDNKSTERFIEFINSL